MNKTSIFALLVILAFFGVGVYFYPQMPDVVASHWDASGQVNGYMGKFWGLFLMPIISLVMFLAFLIIPQIDPLKENVKKFRKYFDGFILAIILFLFYIYILTIVWNLGYRFDMGKFMMPALGILFFFAGVLTENAKRNWFIGVRTPWTLSSEKVWEKTNKLAGKMFKILGVVTFLGVLAPAYTMLLILIPLFLFVVFIFVYSYLEFQKENKTKK